PCPNIDIEKPIHGAELCRDLDPNSIISDIQHEAVVTVEENPNKVVTRVDKRARQLHGKIEIPFIVHKQQRSRARPAGDIYGEAYLGGGIPFSCRYESIDSRRSKARKRRRCGKRSE